MHETKMLAGLQDLALEPIEVKLHAVDVRTSACASLGKVYRILDVGTRPNTCCLFPYASSRFMTRSSFRPI